MTTSAAVPAGPEGATTAGDTVTDRLVAANRRCAEAFTDPVDQDVRQSMRRVRTSPFLPHTGDVRGFVFDVRTGRLREADPA
ncbi:hypothetical protein [Streptomyces sp. NPDC013455]|uniref:hypothetical protein n=1 Tax=Streptomyces sp. NPDC013455 TaxID=3155605 RepID=UPI003405B329